MSSRGKAYTKEQKEFIIRLKQSYDEERARENSKENRVRLEFYLLILGLPRGRERLKKYTHIGVAVDTPEGLVVPVIRDVDRKTILELSRELGEYSAKAWAKKLMPGEMQGAGFTISSLGGIGGKFFTPIINAPEVAILGVTRSYMAPVWNGREFLPRLMLPLSLSYDHRVIDGAQAARFMNHFCGLIGDIRRLLL